MITTCVDKGYLHVGFGDENSAPKKVGTDINVYTNFITKFFSKIFDLSVTLEINGKSRCVNKISLNEHLKSLGLKVVPPENLLYDKIITEYAKKNVSTESFWDSLSEDKRTGLFFKMMQHLVSNETQKVEKLIRKGAYIDRQVFIVENRFANYLESALSLCESSDQGFVGCTPLTYALASSNDKLANYIRNFKSNPDIFDKDIYDTYQVTYCFHGLENKYVKGKLINRQGVKLTRKFVEDAEKTSAEKVRDQNKQISFRELDSALNDVINAV